MLRCPEIFLIPLSINNFPFNSYDPPPHPVYSTATFFTVAPDPEKSEGHLLHGARRYMRHAGKYYVGDVQPDWLKLLFSRIPSLSPLSNSFTDQSQKSSNEYLVHVIWSYGASYAVSHMCAVFSAPCCCVSLKRPVSHVGTPSALLQRFNPNTPTNLVCSTTYRRQYALHHLTYMERTHDARINHRFPKQRRDKTSKKVRLPFISADNQNRGRGEALVKRPDRR